MIVLPDFRVIAVPVALWATLAGAQLPTARLLTISPAGGQVGSTFELSVSGADLDHLVGLRFSDTNVSATPKVSPDTGLTEPNRFFVTVSSNALPATCEVRAVGRFGISNPRAFSLGPWAEIPEKPGNHSPVEAMNIPVNSTVNAHADANAIDHFRIPAKKGQRILVECMSRGIMSRMAPLMILEDEGGREIERARHQDLIDFVAPEDCTNLLKVSDFLFRGGPEFFYRLTVHDGPRVDFVVPPSAQPGTTNKHIVFGRNLPGGKESAMKIQNKQLQELPIEVAAPVAGKLIPLAHPKSLPVRGFVHRLSSGSGAVPFFISFADAPLVSEQDGNDRPETAQMVSVPCEYAGQLYPAGDRDWLQFEAKKGDVFWIEILSDRIGASTDPFFLVQRSVKNEKGETSVADLTEAYDSEASIGGQELKTSSFDPAWRLEVKENATYRIQVRDLFNTTSSNPANLYRLAIRKEAPNFELAVLPQLAATKKEREVTPWSVAMRRGETVPVRVLALRQNGFAGEISVTVEGLPPDITGAPARIESGKNSALLFLTAAPRASNWLGTVRIVGEAKHGERQITKEAVSGATVWRVEDYNTEAAEARLSQDVPIGVVPEPAPLIIYVPATNALEAVAGTKLQVPIALVRNGEFTEKLKLKVAGAQAVDSAREIEIDSKATNATFEIDLAQVKLGSGSHSLYFQTQTKGKYSNDPEGASQAEAAAREADTNAVHFAAEAKKASDAAASATKAVAEAEANARSAAEKLASARSAVEANSADEKLGAAKAEAEQAYAQAASRLAAANEAKASAEKLAAELAAKSKVAEARKTALAARAKELREKAKPKEVTIAVYSQPFAVKVNPAPATASK